MLTSFGKSAQKSILIVNYLQKVRWKYAIVKQSQLLTPKKIVNR